MAALLPGAGPHRLAEGVTERPPADDAAFPGFLPRRGGGGAAGAIPQARATPLTLGLAILLILVFSRGWVSPMVGPNADPESSGLIRSLFLPGYLFALLLLAGDPRAGLNAAIAAVLPLGLVLLAFASALWSIAPDITGRRAVALLFTTLAGVALAARLDWVSLARAMAGAFSLLALGSLFAALAVPRVGVMQEIFPGAWQGVWGDKNALGDYMALGVCICGGAAALDRRLRLAWLGAAGLCLLLIVMSQSKTSLVALAAGLAALLAALLARRSPAAATAVVLAGAAVVVGVAVAFLVRPHFLFGLLGKDSTLTGRTVVWDAVRRRISERPLTGFGYAAVWTDASGWGPLAWISKEAHFTPRHAHNSWLEAELELGLAGLGLLAAFAGQTAWRLLRAGPGMLLAAPVLCAFFVISLTETVILNYNDFLWVLIPALAIRLGLPDGEPPASPSMSTPQRNLERP